MNIGVIATTVIWGIISGYLVIRTTACLAGIGFCLHALVKARWSHLSGKASVRQVSPDIVLRLMFQIALQVVLFGLLLYYGADFVGGTGPDYSGREGILYAVAAFAAALTRLPATRRRMIFYWRMSHEFDYAQRRRRTLLLKS